MSKMISIADAQLDEATVLQFQRSNGVAFYHAELYPVDGRPEVDEDTLQACVDDGTITSTERTSFISIGRKILLRARNRKGLAP